MQIGGIRPNNKGKAILRKKKGSGGCLAELRHVYHEVGLT